MKEPYLLDSLMDRLDSLKNLPWWPFARRVAKMVYVVGEYCFFLLAGGLVFAYLSQVIGFISLLLPVPLNQSTVQHAAWVIGVIFFAIGRPMGWVKGPGFKSGDEPNAQQENAEKTAKEIKEIKNRFVGLAGIFGLIGLCVGIGVTSILVLAWFSISLSPFSPESWHHSVQTASSEINGFTDGQGGGFVSDHPMLIRLFWMPSAILTGLGMIVGMMIWLLEKVQGNEGESRGE